MSICFHDFLYPGGASQLWVTRLQHRCMPAAMKLVLLAGMGEKGLGFRMGHPAQWSLSSSLSALVPIVIVNVIFRRHCLLIVLGV